MVAYKTEGTPYLEERYATKEDWQKDYDAAMAKTKKNVRAAKDLKAYMSEEQWAKIDNFNSKDFEYIKEVKKYNKEIIKIKDEALAAKQKKIEEQKAKEKQNTISSTKKNINASYSGSSRNFKSQGVIYQNGIRYTYYSSRILYHFRTPEWTVGSDGIYRDKNGYIVVASSDHSQGAVVSTPFGAGKVYDSGCPSGTIDIYTNF